MIGQVKSKWGFILPTLLLLIVHSKEIWSQEYDPYAPQYGPQEIFVDVYPKLFPYRAASDYHAPNIPQDLLKETYEEILATITLNTDLEDNIVQQKGFIPLDQLSESARHNAHYLSKPKRLFEVEVVQNHLEELTKRLQHRLSLNTDDVYYSLPKFQLSGIKDGYAAIDTCRKIKNVYCKHNKYRNIDGTCNNPNYPSWGSTFSCFQRIVAPDYSDGISAIRTSVDGSHLPNVRHISTTLHSHAETPDYISTHMLMQWGQIVDHDITFTQPFLADGHFVVDCCKPYKKSNVSYAYTDNPPISAHPRCLPILIPPSDPFFPKIGVNCINFVRSASCLSCSLGPRTQSNQVTAFLDASGVYGNSDDELLSLKDPTDPAKMAVSQSRYGSLLPRSKNPQKDQCASKSSELPCFSAGDIRVNQHPALTSLNTILLRYHNILVDRLRIINPYWSAEILFQETRRIVIAQMNMITFREYIHLVIGPTMMTYFDLWPREYGYTEYNPTINPNLFTEFSTAAYRYGHTLISKDFYRVMGGGHLHSLSLKDNFFNPLPLYNGSLDSILMGLCSQPAEKFDPYIVSDLTNYVYKVPGAPSGIDLMALNLNRGRDHGLKGYIYYIKYCFDIQINTFDDLAVVMAPDRIHKLRSVYKYVQDIDLMTGALHEYRLKTAIVGPTFGCLIGQQYFYMKYGDRHYFEHGNQPGSFTEAQLKELRKTWLSKLICLAGDFIPHMQLDAFQPASKGNEYMTCDEIPDIDLIHWKESY